ncbi:DUF4884 domain-containing protein [Haoranjiania flava]|uniref:DUF4884 domain-containing protein n=1 Tax=Haoranjiania flava TaxID=1856322 RepID=UPI00362D7AD5
MHEKISLFVLLILAFFLLTSCFAKPIARQIPQNNTTYQVDYLFEHDGCKVYRFYDIGEYVYFTNCSGNVTAHSKDSSGQKRIVNAIYKDTALIQK